jgi:hypothetical protein
VLSVNQQGTVLSIDSNTPASLFGFSPECLMGQPLAGFVNVFAEVRIASVLCQHLDNMAC